MAYHRVRFRRQQGKVNLCAVSSTTYFVWKSVTYSLLARWHSLSNLNVFGVAKFWLQLFKLFVILPTGLLEKKSLVCQNTTMHPNTRLRSGFLPPLRSSWDFSDTLHLSWSNHGMGTESFVCLSRLFWFFFLRFCFSFKLRRHKVLVVCEQVFHRTASASQGRGYSGSKKSLGLPSKPKLKITSLKIWLSISLPSNNPLFGGAEAATVLCVRAIYT